MARNHARLLVAIWDDPDWIALTTSHQITYLALLSSRDLSWCGVAPLLPQRLATIADDMNERKVKGSLDHLEQQRFLVIDRSTAEVLVRSYIRHDDFLKQPNVVKAMIKDLAKIRSAAIHDAVISELQRKKKEDSELRGWDTIQSLDPGLFAKVNGNPLRRAS